MRRNWIHALVIAMAMWAVAPASAWTPGSASDSMEEFRLPIAGAHYGAYLHLKPSLPHDVAVSRLRHAGLTVGTDLPAADAVWLTGTAADLRVAQSLPVVEWLQPATRYEPAVDTAAWATRARAASDETGGLSLRLTGPGGAPVDGRGVGIAILDSGIDGTHPDLEWAGLGKLEPKVMANYQVVGGYLHTPDGPLVPGTFAEAPDTDTWGHGTHVAGIAAGAGAAHDGRFRGVAPGAKLYGFNVIKTSPGLDSVSSALQWIYDNGHRVQPPIKVVNLSLGTTSERAHEPFENKLVDALIRDRGITVVLAAMNAGGDGSTANTNNWGRNPTPGVLSVANYDDGGAASTDGRLSSSSSRGLATDPSTWPDVAAPGVDIVAPCTPGRVTCVPKVVHLGGYDYDPVQYASVSGTSMAAPHVAGAAALLYQANPMITPAEVEHLLEATARKFGGFGGGAPYQPDPAHPGATSSYDKGHGLIDVYSALETLLGATEPAAGSTTTVLASDGEDEHLAGATDITELSVTELDRRIRLTLRLRDLDDAAEQPAVYSVTAAVAGRRLSIGITLTGDAAPKVTGSHAVVGAVRKGDDVHVTFDPYLLGVTRSTVLLDAKANTALRTAPGGADTGRMIAVDSTGDARTAHVFAGDF